MTRWIAIASIAVIAVAAIASVALWPDASAAQSGTPAATPNPTATPTPTPTPTLTPLEQVAKRVDGVEEQIATLDGKVNNLSKLHVQPGIITWNCATLKAQQERSYSKKISDYEIQEHVENLNLILGSSPLSETGIQTIATQCGLTLR